MKMYHIPEQPYKGSISAGCLPQDPDRFFDGLKAPVSAEIHYLSPTANSERKMGGRLKDPSKIREMFPFLSIRFPQFVIVLRNLLSSPDLAGSYLPLSEILSEKKLFPFLHLAGTISKNGGSIGYHLDNYHVFIVQVTGRRTWHVWNKNVLTPDETASFIREDPNERVAPIQKKRPADHVFHLGPGEFVFIPALFPHEGITSNESEPSISLSYVYTALSGYKLLKPALENSVALKELPSSFYQIIHSLPLQDEDLANWLHATLDHWLQSLPTGTLASLQDHKEKLLHHWLHIFR